MTRLRITNSICAAILLCFGIHNSYATSIITNTVIHGNDDATSWGESVSNQNWSGESVWCGHLDNYPDLIGAFRFQNIPVTQNTVVVSAQLRVQAYLSGYGQSSLLIKAEAYDSPNPYNLPPYIRERETESSAVIWNIEDPWQEDEVYYSPDISAIVQEIVNRQGWKSGNALAIQLRNNSEEEGVQLIYSKEGADALAHAFYTTPAQLIIEFEGEPVEPEEVVLEGENYIYGATNDPPTHVPLYRNQPAMYYPAEGGSAGICWATAGASIIGYWDRTAYNGITYWNLVEHGTAPLRQSALPAEPGHDEGDIAAVIHFLADEYYGEERNSQEAQILREIINDDRGLGFTVEYWPAVSTTEARTGYLEAIKIEIDAGRPISLGSYGTYFGGAHQVPAYGYRIASNVVDSTVYIHRNTGDNTREYVNIYHTSWGSIDMNRIIPGGTPVDPYENMGNNDFSTNVEIDPDDVYNFRQTHSFSYAGDEDWVRLETQSNMVYTIQTRNLGTNCNTLLSVIATNGMTVLASNDSGGDEPGASRIDWCCREDGHIFIRAMEKHNRHGHDTNYDIEVSYAADSDGDCIPDWMEAIAGTDPDDPEDFFKIERFAPATEENEATLSWQSVEDRIYTVYFSTNLLTGWSNIHERAGNGSQQAFTNSGAMPPAAFIRLGVRMAD